MAFQPRSYEEIRDDMIDYISAQTDLTDYEIGSAIRSLVEAASLEDDEQYFQMVQLLDAFDIESASGTLLKRRVNDADIDYLPASSSTGNVVFRDENLVRSFLNQNYGSGVSIIVIGDGTDFPTSGYPYTIRIGEGTADVEDIDVDDLTVNTLTLATNLQFSHVFGERVSLVTGAGNTTIAAGIQVQTRSNSDDAPIKFTTIERGTLVNGNYESTPIAASSVSTGPQTNVGANTIIEFTGSGPFDGASVTNRARFGGGRDQESDPALKTRYRDKIQSLSRGTVLALKQCVKGVTDPVTQQTVSSSSLLEDFENDEVILFVDDGTGFTPDTLPLARTAFDGAVLAGAGSATLGDVSDFPEEGFVLLSPEDSAQIELIEYTSINYTTQAIGFVGVTQNAHGDNDEVVLVDVVASSAEAGTNYFNLAQFPVVRNSCRVWMDTGAGFLLLTEGTDYILNRGTGQLQIVGDGTPEGTQIVANYTVYTGLVATAQKVVDGVVDNAVVYPGYRAAGIFVVVEVPTIRRITVRISISVKNGFDEDTLALVVQDSIENYINSLEIGADVIRAKLVELAMNVNGVYNAVLVLPLSDVIVGEDEKPIPFLVTVT
jgi:uncharacterized phage protein gp47/JayE